MNDKTDAARIVELEAENKALLAKLREPDRHQLQLEGKHPSPCARHCEAPAYLITERNLRRQLAAAKEENERLKSRLEYRDDGIDGIFCRDQTIAATEQQLAATQLRVKELRVALDGLVKVIKYSPRIHLELEAAYDATDTTDDTSALDKLEAGYQARIVELVGIINQCKSPFLGIDKTDNDEALRRHVACAKTNSFNEGINEAIKVCESLSDWRTLRNPSPDKYVEKIIELKKGEV